MGEVLATRQGERRKMKKFLKKSVEKVFPYLFHGFVIWCFLDGSTDLIRVATWTLSIFGITYLGIGALLLAFHKEVASNLNDNLDNPDKVNREYWLKPQRVDSLVLAWTTSLIAVYADCAFPATLFILGFMLVRFGKYVTSEHLKDNYVI